MAGISGGARTGPGRFASLGAVISDFSVVLGTVYALARVWFAMGRGGLGSRAFPMVAPKTEISVSCASPTGA